MSWKAQKSVERIFNTFKRLKKDIWQNDIDALKQLNTELNSMQESYVVDNILFAKLYCIKLNQDLLHYRDINHAKTKIAKDLKLPLNYHLQILKTSLESLDRISFFESLGIDMDGHGNEPEKLKANEQEIIRKLNSVWPIEKVNQSLLNTVNDLIKDIENYA